MTRIVPDNEAGRTDAIEVLRAGGIVALPTDTVYGVAVALETPGGIERLFHVKQRPPDRGIVLLVADQEQAERIGRFGPAAAGLAAAFWPGGLTLVVPVADGVDLAPALTGGAATIGLRLPAHPTPRALAAAVGPLPTTSANRSGQPEARDASEIVDQIGAGLELILDAGPAAGGPASSVVACHDRSARILRPGSVGHEAIAAVLGALGLSLDPAIVGS